MNNLIQSLALLEEVYKQSRVNLKAAQQIIDNSSDDANRNRAVSYMTRKGFSESEIKEKLNER